MPQLVDAVVGLLVLVSAMVLAPFLYRVVDLGVSAAPPFAALLLRLAVPLLILGLVVSLGVGGVTRP